MDQYWNQFISDDFLTTVNDLGYMLKMTQTYCIIEGATCAHHDRRWRSHRLQTDAMTNFEICTNVCGCLIFPSASMGSRILLKTIYCPKPLMDENDPIENLIQQL